MVGGEPGWRDEDKDVSPDWVDEGMRELLESTAEHRASLRPQGRLTARAWAVRERIAAMNSLAKVAVASVALVVAAVLGVPLLPTGGSVLVNDPAPSASASGPSLEPAPTDPFPVLVLPPGVHEVDRVKGASPFSFTVPKVKRGEGWTAFGDLYISRNSVEPQGAEAMIYWTGVSASSDGKGVEACDFWWGRPVNRTSDNLATATADNLATGVATTFGTELVAGPTDVTVGGHPAKRVVLTIRGITGCEPGLLYTWESPNVGPAWSGTEVGDTIRIWIVDVDGARLYIEGDTHVDADPELQQEVERIVESIRFAEPD